MAAKAVVVVVMVVAMVAKAVVAKAVAVVKAIAVARAVDAILFSISSLTKIKSLVIIAVKLTVWLFRPCQRTTMRFFKTVPNYRFR